LLSIAVDSVPTQCPYETPLPPYCFNPSGDDCKFYPNCLEAKYQCGPNGYPLAYGENYCSRYTELLLLFSTQGKTWVNAVRKCLQSKLVDLLKNCDQRSCIAVEKEAFSSHFACYMKPEEGLSVCNLTCLDYKLIYYAISPSLIDAPSETTNAFWSVIRKCPLNFRMACGIL